MGNLESEDCTKDDEIQGHKKGSKEGSKNRKEGSKKGEKIQVQGR